MSDETPGMGHNSQNIKERLDYDPATGIFRWRARAVRASHLRTDRGWNTKYAGHPAGKADRLGYIHIHLFGVMFKAHRLAWLFVHGRWPEHDIDHIDRNPSNNAISNLRLATTSQNAANRSLYKNNTSGVKGVTFHAPNGKWRARLQVSGKTIYLGNFATLEAAADAYERAARLHCGEFANIEARS